MGKVVREGGILEAEGLWLLPCEDVTSEVTVAGGLLEDGVLQLQVLHDAAGPQVKVLLDNLGQLSAALRSSAVVEDCDRQRLGNSDSVGNLDEAPLGKTSLDQRLSDPSGGISSRSVHLGVVLSGESTTSVSSPASVGINDDLPSGQTGVTHGSSDHEVAAGVDVVLGLGGNVLLGDGGQHHFLHDVLPQSLQGDLLRMLAGNNNGVDPGGDASSVVKVVLTGDLGLGVWPSPPQCAVAPQV